MIVAAVVVVVTAVVVVVVVMAGGGPSGAGARRRRVGAGRIDVPVRAGWYGHLVKLPLLRPIGSPPAGKFR